jgi:hypothetical protein
MNVIKRRAGPFRKRFEFRFWQKTVTCLYRSKVVEDHGVRLIGVIAGITTHGAMWSDRFLCILLTGTPSVNRTLWLFAPRCEKDNAPR